MGILKVTGSIDLAQFWPDGQSDADTAKLLVSVKQDSFMVKRDNSGNFEPTRVFEGAKVRGSVTKEVIDKKGCITVRLQGIDAPELHYRAAPLKNKSGVSAAARKKYNDNNKTLYQHLGESATIALKQKLAETNKSIIDCQVVSAVDKPNDVFDTYGRFVGNIIVTIAGREIDINTWLVEEGWAFPGLYVSMSADEIQTILNAAKLGRKNTKRLWKKLQPTIGKLDISLLYKHGLEGFKIYDDAGPLVMPKLFRRLHAWDARKKAGLTKATFHKYLAEDDKPKSEKVDWCYLTSNFLSQGLYSAVQYHVSEFHQAGDKFIKDPGQLVFTEKTSTLYDANGKKIQDW